MEWRELPPLRPPAPPLLGRAKPDLAALVGVGRLGSLHPRYPAGRSPTLFGSVGGHRVSTATTGGLELGERGKRWFRLGWGADSKLGKGLTGMADSSCWKG